VRLVRVAPDAMSASDIGGLTVAGVLRVGVCGAVFFLGMWYLPLSRFAGAGL